jgi:hypothetical protein
LHLTPLRAATLVALLVTLASGPAAAAVGQWSWIGPDGGDVTGVVGDPADAGTSYATSFAGLFKTSDRGDHWTRLGGDVFLGLH